MPQNPLFPTNNNNDAGKPEPALPHGYTLPTRSPGITPLSNEEKATIGANPASELIREKLARIYATEPDARAEEREAEVVKPRSRHQQFMFELSTSGKSLADIQTEWHAYYTSLSDDEKHEVWQEFYANNQPQTKPELSQPTPAKARDFVTSQAQQRSAVISTPDEPSKPSDERTPSAIASAIRNQVAKRTARMSTSTKHNLHSLAFGLATGFVVLLIFLFGFFNEVIIAPFIQPGRTSAAPVIVTSNSIDASQPSIIIPKINVQIPTVYDPNNNGTDAAMQLDLEQGVTHYPSTELPGEKGNTAFFGHSSNNIFNKGKYKFAFVLLHKLQKGDTFYLTYNDTVYGYKVISSKIVDPSQVDVLYDIPGETATATLITCDPPGTSLHRLVVVGEQVTPDPLTNSTSDQSQAPASSQITGNGPTLWTRLWRSIF
jgi:LPXTG-site transpeptidase (sortase) family protein